MVLTMSLYGAGLMMTGMSFFVRDELLAAALRNSSPVDKNNI